MFAILAPALLLPRLFFWFTLKPHTGARQVKPASQFLLCQLSAAWVVTLLASVYHATLRWAYIYILYICMLFFKTFSVAATPAFVKVQKQLSVARDSRQRTWLQENLINLCDYKLFIPSCVHFTHVHISTYIPLSTSRLCVCYQHFCSCRVFNSASASIYFRLFVGVSAFFLFFLLRVAILVRVELARYFMLNPQVLIFRTTHSYSYLWKINIYFNNSIHTRMKT